MPRHEDTRLLKSKIEAGQGRLAHASHFVTYEAPIGSDSLVLFLRIPETGGEVTDDMRTTDSLCEATWSKSKPTPPLLACCSLNFRTPYSIVCKIPLLVVHFVYYRTCFPSRLGGGYETQSD